MGGPVKGVSFDVLDHQMTTLYTFPECQTEVRIGPMVMPVPPMHDRCRGTSPALRGVLGGARCICPCHRQHKEKAMTWSLNANGHINSEPNSEESEKKLAKTLADAIKSLPTEDVSTVSFSGNYVTGDLRTLDLDGD